MFLMKKLIAIKIYLFGNESSTFMNNIEQNCLPQWELVLLLRTAPVPSQTSLLTSPGRKCYESTIDCFQHQHYKELTALYNSL